MKNQGHRLIAVGSRNEQALLDVVFVHGLTGGPYSTWNGIRDEPETAAAEGERTADFESLDSDCAGENFWPAWLDQDLRGSGAPSVNLWSLGYPAPMLSRNDPLAYPESMRTGVRPLVRRLALAGVPVSENTGVVFVGHSLGGLMIKAALDYARGSSDPKERRLVERCVGVAFLGTPHAGSGLASLLANLDNLLGAIGIVARVVSWISGAPLTGRAIGLGTGLAGWFAKPSNQVNWLEKAGAELRVLAEEYRSIAVHYGISTRAFYETQPLKRLPAKHLMWIVDASNADPGLSGCRPTPVPGADHTTICKPSRDSVLHADLRAWLRDLAQAKDRGKGRAWLRDEIYAVLVALAHSRPALAEVITPMPRRWEDIPENVRAPFSHELRDRIHKVLDGGLATRLEHDHALVNGLALSDWDLDRFVLMLWLGRDLTAAFQTIDRLLREQAGSFDRHVGPGAPSLIPTFRLVDAFREALVQGAANLEGSFKEMHDAVKSAHSRLGQAVDGNGRTRKILSDGIQMLLQAQNWKKPPK
jgi:hypothetical protein